MLLDCSTVQPVGPGFAAQMCRKIGFGFQTTLIISGRPRGAVFPSFPVPFMQFAVATPSYWPCCAGQASHWCMASVAAALLSACLLTSLILET